MEKILQFMQGFDLVLAPALHQVMLTDSFSACYLFFCKAGSACCQGRATDSEVGDAQTPPHLKVTGTLPQLVKHLKCFFGSDEEATAEPLSTIPQPVALHFSSFTFNATRRAALKRKHSKLMLTCSASPLKNTHLSKRTNSSFFFSWKTSILVKSLLFIQHKKAQ